MTEINLEPIHWGPFAHEIARDVSREAHASAPELFDVPIEDLEPIASAVREAAERGILRGIALVTDAINESGRVHVNAWLQDEPLAIDRREE